MEKERQLHDMRMQTEALKNRLSHRNSSASKQIGENNSMSSIQSFGVRHSKIPKDLPLPQKARQISPLRNKSKSRSPPQRIETDVDLYPSRPETYNFNTIVKRMDNFGLNQPSLQSQKTLSQGDKLKLLKIDTQSLQRRLDIVLKELEKVKNDFINEVNSLNRVSSQNKRLQLVIQDDQEIINQSKSEFQLLQKTQLENEGIKNDVYAVEDEHLELKDKLSQIKMQLDNQNLLLRQNQVDLDKSYKREEVLIADIDRLKDEIQQMQSKLGENEHRISQCDSDTKEIEEVLQKDKQEYKELLEEFEKLLIQSKNDEALVIKEVRRVKYSANNQTKILAAMCMFKVIQCCVTTKQQEAFKLTGEYSQFEKHCNTHLKKLNVFIQRRANILRKDAFAQWFKNSLKPMELFKLNNDLVVLHRNKLMMHKAFYEIISQLQVKKDKMNLHHNAVQILLHQKDRKAKVEMCRAFGIWKQTQQIIQHQNMLIKKIVVQHYKAKISIALNRWRNYSIQVDRVCRLELLKREFTQKLYINSIQSSLQVHTSIQRHLKRTMLVRFFKYWKDYISKRKFKRHLNATACIFLEANTRQTLQQCFSALRMHKEVKKVKILESALNEDVDQSLNKLKNTIAKQQRSQQTKNQKLLNNVIQTMLGRYIYSYIAKWKEFTMYKRNMIQARLKDQIIKVYNNKMREVFELWKTCGAKAVKSAKKKQMMSIELESSAVAEEVKAVAAVNKKQAEAVRSAQQKKTIKQSNMLQKRYLKNSMLRWREVMNSQQNKEGKAELIIKKMRKNFLKQAFGSYKSQVQKQQYLEAKEERFDEIIDRWNKKKLKSYIAAWQAYNHVNKENAKYLKRFMLFMINGSIRRALKRWQYGGKLCEEDKMMSTYNQIGDLNVQNNALLAKCINQTDAMVQEISKIEELQVVKSRRILKNYMMRMYEMRLTNAWRTWKGVYKRHSQRDNLMLKYLMRYKRKYFDLVILAFRNNAKKEKSELKKRIVFETQLQCEEVQNYISQNQEVAQKQAAQIRSKLEVRSRPILAKNPNAKVQKCDIEVQEDQQEKIHNIIINRNLFKFFISKKRSVFAEWKNAIKVEKIFMYRIVNVISKGQYYKGFNAILEESRHRKGKILVEKVLTKMFLTRYNLEFLKQSFNMWKASLFQVATTELNDFTNDYKSTVVAFQNKIVRTKDQNVACVLRHFQNRKKFKIWQAWQKERHTLYEHKYFASQSSGVFNVFNKRKCLSRWYSRTKETQRLRFKWQAFHDNYNFRMKQKVFEVLQFKKNVNNTMAVVMGNLEYFMRTKMLDDSFGNIKSYSISKKNATTVFKRRATNDIVSILTQRHFKLTRMYFNRYWKKIYDRQQRIKRLRAIYGKFYSQMMHMGWRKWQFYIWKEQDIQEQNETGPITEQVFEANRLIRNLKEFMKSEGYTSENIKQVYEKAVDTQHNRLHKAILRWKIGRNRDKRLLMQSFDHLKLAVKIRKCLRYYLNYSNNRVTHIKADMQEAFRKWKLGDTMTAINNDKIPFKDLQLKNLKQSHTLMDLAEKEQYNNAVIRHLSVQRDELLAHYIRGQKLALSLCHNKLITGKGKYFSRWKRLTSHGNREKDKQIVLDWINKLTEKKEQARALEQLNLQMADENDELRGFSIQGFNIAKSINQITEDRENLTSDLADYANQITALLEKRERLLKALQEQYEINNHLQGR